MNKVNEIEHSHPAIQQVLSNGMTHNRTSCNALLSQLADELQVDVNQLTAADVQTVFRAQSQRAAARELCPVGGVCLICQDTQ